MLRRLDEGDRDRLDRELELDDDREDRDRDLDLEEGEERRRRGPEDDRRLGLPEEDPAKAASAALV